MGAGARFGDGMERPPAPDQRVYRFHEDSEGGGPPVPDAPPLAAAPQWPSTWSPPWRWATEALTPGAALQLRPERGAEPAATAEAGCKLCVLAEEPQWLRVSHAGGEWWVARAEAADALTAAWLGAALEGLEALRRCPGAPLGAAAVAAPLRLQGAASYAERAPPVLHWLCSLPAQWAAADLGCTFGNFQTWKYSSEKFAELGGSRFHPGDIVCPDVRHLPRTGGTRSCCVVVNALEVLQRMRAAVDPGFEPMEWPRFATWVSGGRKGKRPAPPSVPSASLARLSAHDAIDGMLACFFYTYNLQCPLDLERRRVLELPGEGSPEWEVSGLRVKKVAEGGRAARAGVKAKDVILELDGAPVGSDAELQQRAERARAVGMVAARSEPRPLQLFGCVNWAMREAAGAEGEHAQRIRRALSVFKPFIWRLDRFILDMQKREAVLFRGLAMVRTARHYTIGMQIVFAAFTSLSENAQVAWKFAGENGGTWLSVQVYAALDACWASQYPGEKELLLPSNTPVRVSDKPADDVNAVLCTTNDAVSLVQVEGGDDRRSPDAVLRQRLDALKAQQVIFSTFNASYVEPRVRRESDGAELRLKEAADAFLNSDAQWCVVIGAAGEGKSSALLWLFAQYLGRADTAGGGAGAQSAPPRVPLFISLPLVKGVTTEADWFRRQASEQLSLTPAGWEELSRRGAMCLADSADESGAPPEALRARSLAARSGLPAGSKGILSVREEDLRRMAVGIADLGGEGCAVLRLQPFDDAERGALCARLAERAAEQAPDLLRRAKGGFAAALERLPACLPGDELLAGMQDAAARGDTDRIAELKVAYAAEATERTLQRLGSLQPRARENTLVTAMAAEVAAGLPDGAGATAVMEASLQRRMGRGAVRVDPATWQHVQAAGPEGRVAALMRAAEAVAAALTLQKKWGGQIGAVAEAAHPLWGVDADVAALVQLFPGLPLRTPSAEDPRSHFALPHRQVHEWLAARWAVRATLAGRGAEAMQVVDNLKYWAGAWGVAADAAAQVAAAAQQVAADAQGAEEGRELALRAMQARIAAAALVGDKGRAAAELAELVVECERDWGEHRDLAADALYWQGEALIYNRQRDQAVAPLRRSLALREELLGAGSAAAADARRWLGTALSMTWSDDNIREGVQLLRQAREAYIALGGAGSFGALKCDGALAHVAEHSGERGRREARGLFAAQLRGLELAVGSHHPDTLTAVERCAWLEEDREQEVALWRRCYYGRRQILPRGHPLTSTATTKFAAALYLTESAADRKEAGEVLRAEGAWAEKEAERRQLHRDQECQLGRGGYAAWLRGAGRADCAQYYPELLPEVDEQLRRMEAGEEPYDGADRRLIAHQQQCFRQEYPRRGRAAYREWLMQCDEFAEQHRRMEAGDEPFDGADELLRAHPDTRRPIHIQAYAVRGPPLYARWLDGELARSPSLAPVIAEQRRRMADGQEPLEGADSALRRSIEAERQTLYEEYKNGGIRAYEERLLQRKRLHYAKDCPAYLPEATERVKWLGEGREPFDDSAPLASHHLLGAHRAAFACRGAALYGDWLRAQRAECPALAPMIDEQLRRMGAGQEPVEGAEAALAAFIEKERQQHREVYSKRGPKGYEKFYGAARGWYEKEGQVFLDEYDAQMHRLREGAEPFGGADQLMAQFIDAERAMHRKVYAERGREGYHKWLQGNLKAYEVGRRAFLDEVTERLRRLEAGAEPFDGADELHREHEAAKGGSAQKS